MVRLSGRWPMNSQSLEKPIIWREAERFSEKEGERERQLKWLLRLIKSSDK